MTTISTRQTRLAALLADDYTPGQKADRAATAERLAAADRDPSTRMEWSALVTCDPQGYDGYVRIGMPAAEVTSTDEHGRPYTITVPERTVTVTAVDTGRDVRATERPRADKATRRLHERSAVPVAAMRSATHALPIGTDANLTGTAGTSWCEPVRATDLEGFEPLLRALWHGQRPATMAEARERLSEATDAATLDRWVVIGAAETEPPRSPTIGGRRVRLDAEQRRQAKRDAARATLLERLASPEWAPPVARRGRPALWVTLWAEAVDALQTDDQHAVYNYLKNL